MKNNINGNSININFFIIDGFKNIVSFKPALSNTIELLLQKKPQIGQAFVDVFPQDSVPYLSDLLKKCLQGNCIMAEDYVTSKIVKSTVKVHVIFIPIQINVNVSYAVCLVLPDLFSSDRFLLNNDYSMLASHKLRAPITNILSLSNFENYSKLQSFEGLKISELLMNIHEQAERLNEIIDILNTLINNNEETNAIKTIYKKESANHIVLVDDDPIVNMMHKMILSKYKKSTLVKDFENPKQALEYIKVNKPDLIFLDINMPEINGWEFLQRLEEYDFKSHVIVVSSSIDPSEKLKAFAHECVKDFIIKPLTYEKLENLFF